MHPASSSVGEKCPRGEMSLGGNVWENCPGEISGENALDTSKLQLMFLFVNFRCYFIPRRQCDSCLRQSQQALKRSDQMEFLFVKCLNNVMSYNCITLQIIIIFFCLIVFVLVDNTKEEDVPVSQEELPVYGRVQTKRSGLYLLFI